VALDAKATLSLTTTSRESASNADTDRFAHRSNRAIATRARQGPGVNRSAAKPALSHSDQGTTAPTTPKLASAEPVARSLAQALPLRHHCDHVRSRTSLSHLVKAATAWTTTTCLLGPLSARHQQALGLPLRHYCGRVDPRDRECRSGTRSGSSCGSPLTSASTKTQHCRWLRSLVVTLLLPVGSGSDRPVASSPAGPASVRRGALTRTRPEPCIVRIARLVADAHRPPNAVRVR
jgi:hypothetical protein